MHICSCQVDVGAGTSWQPSYCNRPDLFPRVFASMTVAKMSCCKLTALSIAECDLGVEAVSVRAGCMVVLCGGLCRGGGWWNMGVKCVTIGTYGL